MSNLSIEYFKVLFLDQNYRLIKDEFLSNGNENTILISPNELVKKAIFHNAKSMIIAHNHPSGNTSPSKNDIITTKQLIQACSIFNITIIDHIIISQNETYSFKENNLM